MTTYYTELMAVLAEQSGFTEAEILGGRSEECADLRSILVALLSTRYANYEVARLTGLSRQSVTRITALHPIRIKRKYSMMEQMRAVEQKMRIA